MSWHGQVSWKSREWTFYCCGLRCRQNRKNQNSTSPGGVLSYMGYIVTCRGIGYGFWGSRSLYRVSFFYPFYFMLHAMHPMLQSRNKVFLFMLLIILFFPWIGCHFSALGLREGISFRFLSPSRHTPMQNLREYPPGSTSMFGRLGQKIAPKSAPHIQHDYFSSFNQSKHWLVVLSLPLPFSFLKLPIAQMASVICDGTQGAIENTRLVFSTNPIYITKHDLYYNYNT